MSYSNYDARRVCPYCTYPDCSADWVDVEVGLVQCGPFICDHCGACEIGPYDHASETMLQEIERKTRWYLPDRTYLTSAPTHNGKPVDHETAQKLYRLGLLDKKDD
jgi:hypothetical protein